MNHDLNRHEKNDKIKWIATAVALILLTCACVTSIAMGVKNSDRIKKNEETKTTVSADVGGMEIGEVKGNGVSLLSARIAAEDYEEYGISAQAENAYTLTATVTPANAANKKVDWTVAFKNPSSEWAAGKTVTDYVTVTPSADGALTAVVENKAAFGEQIVVKVTSRENSAISATCSVEYLQRVDYTFELSGFSGEPITFSSTGTKTHSLTLDFSAERAVFPQLTCNQSTVYTRAASNFAWHYTIKPTEEFKTALTNAGFNASSLCDWEGDRRDTLVMWQNFFESNWGKALHNDNVTQKNKLIDALVAFSGNAYEIGLYTEKGGTELEKFYITLDTSAIETQRVVAVESIALNQSEIEF